MHSKEYDQQIKVQLDDFMRFEQNELYYKCIKYLVPDNLALCI